MVASEFDREEFLEWLDDKEGPILNSTLKEEWPAFPHDELGACTGPIVDGELAAYQCDLRRIAEGRPILD